LNATVWLSSNFEEPLLKDSIDVYQEQLKIKVSNLTTALSSSHISIDKYAKVKIAEMYTPLNTANNFTIEKNVSSTIAGISAYKIVYTSKNAEGIDLKNMTIWAINKNRVYDITYSALAANYSYYLPTIQDMIDSLTFENGYTAADNNTNNTKPINLGDNSNNTTTNDVLKFEGLGMKINYPVDWQKKQEITDEGNSRSIVFTSPFEDVGMQTPSWHETAFTMALAIDSAQHAGVTDYRVILSRNPVNNSKNNNNDNNNSNNNNNNQNSTWGWTKQITEVSAEMMMMRV
jgi:hypothetical protein